ncbi:hypothetical protein D3C87_1874810 [compost metagenome]
MKILFLSRAAESTLLKISLILPTNWKTSWRAMEKKNSSNAFQRSVIWQTSSVSAKNKPWAWVTPSFLDYLLLAKSLSPFSWVTKSP